MSSRVFIQTVAVLSVLSIAEVAGPAAAGNTTDPLMVTVNGVKVTERQVEALLGQQISMAMAFGQMPDDVMVHNLRIRAVDEIIERILINERARVKGIRITEEGVSKKIEQIAENEGVSVNEFIFKSLPANNTNYSEFKDRVIMGMKFDKLIEAEAGKKAFAVSEDEARRYYKRNINEFYRPGQVRASHIMIKYPSLSKQDKADVKEAMGIIRQMVINGTDFAKLAVRYSEDKATAEKGGDLGRFTEGNMLPEIVDAAFKLKVGQISDVVEVNYGCHLVMVTEVDEGGLDSFEKVEKDILRWIQEDKKAAYSEKYMDSLIGKARIKWPDGRRPEPIKVN